MVIVFSIRVGKQELQMRSILFKLPPNEDPPVQRSALTNKDNQCSGITYSLNGKYQQVFGRLNFM